MDKTITIGYPTQRNKSIRRPMKPKSNLGTILVLNSKNAKLGPGVAATYVSQESCPKTCPLLDDGC